VSRILQKILPGRIITQIAALIVTSLVVANVAIGALFLVQAPEWLENSGGMLANLVFTAKLLDATRTPEARAEILQSARASYPELSYLDAVTPAPSSELPNSRLVSGLQSALGGRFRVIATDPIEGDAHGLPRVAVRLPQGGFIAASIPPPTHPPWILIGVATFLATVLTLVCLWVARALTSPLARFVEAAEHFSVGGSDVPLKERGPTEVRRLARALNEMRDRIRAMIADRTRMLAAVGHDLRTPITRLRLRAEDIEGEPLRAQVVRDLDAMQRMVQAALSFLREQTVPPGKRVRTDLSSVVQSLCDDFTDLGHELKLNAPLHVYVDCDVEQLTRAITNLVENALRYGNAVSIRLMDCAEEIFIEVEDNGPGINPEERSKVTLPFYRGDPARSPDEDGHFGLGLSIALTIIEAHRGRLELHEAVPHGLVARIVLPTLSAHETCQREASV
jgi:signal transduction histidine kinase